MEFEFVFIKFLWKDAASNVGNCASLSRVNKGTEPGYAVNGEPISEEMRRTIPHAAELGEAAVWVPANVIDRIRDLS